MLASPRGAEMPASHPSHGRKSLLRRRADAHFVHEPLKAKNPSHVNNWVQPRLASVTLVPTDKPIAEGQLEVPQHGVYQLHCGFRESSYSVMQLDGKEVYRREADGKPVKQVRYNLSDAAAGLVGGLGFAASGCYGESYAYFESAHGTAPDIAGQGIINPTANLLSACMMLEHLDLATPAARIRAAIASVYAEAKELTPDQGGSASTLEFCNAVGEIL